MMLYGNGVNIVIDEEKDSILSSFALCPAISSSFYRHFSAYLSLRRRFSPSPYLPHPVFCLRVSRAVAPVFKGAFLHVIASLVLPFAIIVTLIHF